MTAVDVDALDKLREAATAGPWVVQNCADETFDSEDHRGWWWVWREDALPYYGGVMDMESHPPNCVIGSCEITDSREGDKERADAALIVAVVNALPDLLAEVRRGRALREAVEGLTEQWAEMARDHDEQSASNTAMVYRAHARSLTAVLAAVDGAGQ